MKKAFALMTTLVFAFSTQAKEITILPGVLHFKILNNVSDSLLTVKKARLSAQCNTNYTRGTDDGYGLESSAELKQTYTEAAAINGLETGDLAITVLEGINLKAPAKILSKKDCKSVLNLEVEFVDLITSHKTVFTSGTFLTFNTEKVIVDLQKIPNKVFTLESNPMKTSLENGEQVVRCNLEFRTLVNGKKINEWGPMQSDYRELYCR